MLHQLNTAALLWDVNVIHKNNQQQTNIPNSWHGRNKNAWGGKREEELKKSENWI